MTYAFSSLSQIMGLTENAAMKQLRIAGSTARRYREEGLSERVADRMAIRAGFHPCEVWPDWLEDQQAAVSRPCPVCAVLFVPNGRRKFCSDRCRSTFGTRRYRSTVQGTAGNREARMRYYWENVEYERRRHAAWRAVNRDVLNAKQRARSAAKRAAA